MAEMLAAALALPDAPVVLPGATLELAPPLTRLSLRGRDVDLLSRVAKLALPTRIGDFHDSVAKLGPDEWLALLNPPPLGEVAARRAGGGSGSNNAALTDSPLPTPSVSLREPPLPEGEDLAALSIVDISSRAIGIIVTGPRAAERIGTGCPLDLARMAPGRATRTVFETVEIILIRTGEEQFHIEVWRSFAPWLFAALSA